MQVHLQPPRQAYMPMAIPQDRPVYRLKGQIYADDELYEAGAIIAWEGEPNMEMEPMNTLANEQFASFIKKLDDLGRAAAKQAGKAYRSLADAYTVATELAEQKGRRIEMLNATKEVPIMGGKIKKRGSRVDASGSTPLINTDNKHSLMNTHASVNTPFSHDVDPFTGKPVGKNDGNEKES